MGNDELRKYIRGIIKEIAEEEEELEEINATGNIDGGEGPPKTPHAFKKSSKKKHKAGHQDGHKSPEVLGYKRAPITSLFKEAISKELKDFDEWIRTDTNIQKRRWIPIYKNLSVQMKKGSYNKRDANKAFAFLVADALKKYHGTVNKSDLKTLIQLYVNLFESEYKKKTYDFMK